LLKLALSQTKNNNYFSPEKEEKKKEEKKDMQVQSNEVAAVKVF